MLWRGQAGYRAGACSPCHFAGGTDDFFVEYVKKPTDNNNLLCFTGAAPGPVLRVSRTEPGTDEARVPMGIMKETGVACGLFHQEARTRKNTTRVASGIP
jgi:hypothetical protein